MKMAQLFFLLAAKNMSYRIDKSIIPSQPAHKNDSQNIREFISNTNGIEVCKDIFPFFPLLGVRR